MNLTQPPKLPDLPDNDAVRAAIEVVRKLDGAGHEAVFVGGFIRDWLLGEDPYDVDVATSATPEDIEKLFDNTKAVGASFGVMLVQIGDHSIETATFRKDGEYVDFRRPTEVTFGTMEEDAARRDFTVNAMFYDPIRSKLHDFYTGRLDLRRRILRTVGKPRERFDEDALRLMRGVRLANRYDFSIENHTRKAMAARAKHLAEISKERIGGELIRILTGPNPGRAVRTMSELGMWAHIVPEIEDLHGVEQGREYHPEGDVFEHTVKVMENLPDSPPPALAIGALLHDIGKPATFERKEGRISFHQHQFVGEEMARVICERLRLGNAVSDLSCELVRNHMRFLDVRKMREAKLKRFVTMPDFQLHLDLHRADILGSSGDLDYWHFCIEQREALAVEHGEELLPPPLLKGDDLIAMGLEPGPIFKELLESIHDEQIEGRIHTREEAEDFVRETVKRGMDD